MISRFDSQIPTAKDHSLPCALAPLRLSLFYISLSASRFFSCEMCHVMFMSFGQASTQLKIVWHLQIPSGVSITSSRSIRGFITRIENESVRFEQCSRTNIVSHPTTTRDRKLYNMRIRYTLPTRKVSRHPHWLAAAHAQAEGFS